MRGFFSITRAFIGVPKFSALRIQTQQQKLQMRIVLNRVTQIMRMSTSVTGLRMANVYDMSLLSLLDEAQGNCDIIQEDESNELDARQIGLHIGCTI
ncbi:hypothetical protein pb186bvf_008691 [Paramecium bursaria]